MISLRTVLCPIDFSAATDRQVALAVDLCRAFGSRLVLHHNLAAPPTGASVGWMWAADHPTLNERTVEQKFEDLLLCVPDVVQTEARITHGQPSSSVVAVSEAVDADLVILSTHVTSDDDHASITERLLEQGDRAVLALHDTSAERRTLTFSTPSSLEVFAVPTDLTPESRPAVGLAFDLARQLPVEVHLLHFIGRKRGNGETTVAEAQRRMASMVPDDFVGRVCLHVESGAAARGIAEAAAHLSAACIVMGEHTRAPLRRWFSRDTSRAVLHEAPCPVWYVPGGRAA